MALNCLGVDLGDNERHFGIHAERARIIDDNGACLHRRRCKGLACRASRKERDVNAVERILRRFLHRIRLAHKVDFLACTARGSEKTKLCKRELALLDEVQKLLPDSSRSAKNGDVILFHKHFSFP